MDSRRNEWTRSIETVVVAVTMLGGGLSAAVWVVVFSVIPAFDLKASHPQYASPNTYIWGYVALAAIIGVFAGLADALIFHFLRRTTRLVSDRVWLQCAAAFLASVFTASLTYLIFLRGEPHTNAFAFILVCSAISLVGFLVWIFLINRSRRVAIHGSVDTSESLN